MIWWCAGSLRPSSIMQPCQTPKRRQWLKCGLPRTRSLRQGKESQVGYVFKCVIVLHVSSYFFDCFCACVMFSGQVPASRVVPHDQCGPLRWPHLDRALHQVKINATTTTLHFSHHAFWMVGSVQIFANWCALQG